VLGRSPEARMTMTVSLHADDKDLWKLCLTTRDELSEVLGHAGSASNLHADPGAPPGGFPYPSSPSGAAARGREVHDREGGGGEAGATVERGVREGRFSSDTLASLHDQVRPLVISDSRRWLELVYMHPPLPHDTVCCRMTEGRECHAGRANVLVLVRPICHLKSA
jgi:hypothetical protein